MAPSTNAMLSTVYCTYFDGGYLARGLSLVESIRAHGDTSKIIVLALDSAVETYFSLHPQPELKIISLQDLESFEPRLLEVKQGRSQAEYYFTCTPILIKYAQTLLSRSEDIAIYLDADLYFFESPAMVIDEFGAGSIGIIEHKYSKKFEQKLKKYGRFNVGWVAFRNDQFGHNLLRWYCDSTLTWCSDKPTNGLYADQGYLDSFPDWSGTVVLKTPGANLAPWNVGNYQLTRTNHGNILVDAFPLLFFHFHGIKSRGPRYVTAEMMYGFRLTKELRNAVYEPYLRKLSSYERAVKATMPQAQKPKARGNGLQGTFFRLYKSILFFFAVLTKNSIKVD